MLGLQNEPTSQLLSAILRKKVGGSFHFHHLFHENLAKKPKFQGFTIFKITCFFVQRLEQVFAILMIYRTSFFDDWLTQQTYRKKVNFSGKTCVCCKTTSVAFLAFFSVRVRLFSKFSVRVRTPKRGFGSGSDQILGSGSELGSA